MNRISHHRLRDLKKGRAMLLTNTINAQTTVITAVNGTVINGVALRGCSACPVHFADRPSEKRASKHPVVRISERSDRRRSRGMHAMYLGDPLSWQQLWLDSSASMQQASGLLLGFASGRSLS